MIGGYDGFDAGAARVRQLRSVAGRIGLTMLFHTLLFNMLFATAVVIDDPLRAAAAAHPGAFGGYAADIASGVVEICFYLLAFMILVAFFRLISPRRTVEPMRLGVRLTSDTLAVVLFGIAVTVGASYVNYYMLLPFGSSSADVEELPTNAVGVIISFISTALVPAVCEEFLFRGCILSNLLPFGKKTAVIGSAVLFALMHNNTRQFFYTAAAGIVFGLVYIETGSIWAGTFIHLFNNFFAVIDEAVQATVAPEYAAAISLLGNVLVITAGLVSGVYLVFRRAGKRTDGSQPQPIVPGEECGTLKSFFTPAMITYFAVALLAAVMNML